MYNQTEGLVNYTVRGQQKLSNIILIHPSDPYPDTEGLPRWAVFKVPGSVNPRARVTTRSEFSVS